MLENIMSSLYFSGKKRHLKKLTTPPTS